MQEIAIAGLTAFGFSAIGGYLAGYAVKKILIIAFKIVAIVLGAFFMGLFYMQYAGYVTVAWEKIGEDLYNFSYNTVSGTLAGTGTDPVSAWVQHMVNTIGYASSGGFGGGFLVGFLRTK